MLEALALDAEACIEHARNHSWYRSVQLFHGYQRNVRNGEVDCSSAEPGVITAA